MSAGRDDITKEFSGSESGKLARESAQFMNSRNAPRFWRVGRPIEPYDCVLRTRIDLSHRNRRQAGSDEDEGNQTFHQTRLLLKHACVSFSDAARLLSIGPQWETL